MENHQTQKKANVKVIIHPGNHMNKPHISIPKPCHENWDAMHPGEQGRHCDACDKTVIDFTKSSDSEIGEYFAEHAGTRICGYFRKSQLHIVPSRLHASLLQLHASASRNIKRHALRAIALFFIGMIMSMTGCTSKHIEHEDTLVLGNVPRPQFRISDTTNYFIDGEAQVDYDTLCVKGNVKCPNPEKIKNSDSMLKGEAEVDYEEMKNEIMKNDK